MREEGRGQVAEGHIGPWKEYTCLEHGPGLNDFRCVLQCVMVALNPAVHYNYLGVFFFFLATLGLRCCAQAFSSCSERGLLFVLVRGLIAVVSLAAEHRL